MQAMEADNRTLRSRLSALEHQLHHDSAGAEQASPTISTPTMPVHLAAAASSGTGGTPAGALEHMASQVHTTPLICRQYVKWARSGVAAVPVRDCCSGHLASTTSRSASDELRGSCEGSLFSTDVSACLDWQLWPRLTCSCLHGVYTRPLQHLHAADASSAPSADFPRYPRNSAVCALAGKHNIQSGCVLNCRAQRLSKNPSWEPCQLRRHRSLRTTQERGDGDGAGIRSSASRTWRSSCAMRALQPAGPQPPASASRPQLRLLIPQQLPLLAQAARQRAPPSTWPLR